MSQAASKRRSVPIFWPSLILAMLAGMVTGAAPLAAYAYGTAELIWPVWLASYLALAVPPCAAAVAVLVTAAVLRWRHVHHRVAFAIALIVALLVVYALGNALRFYPPDQLGLELPGYAEWSPSLDRLTRAMGSQGVPVLGAMFGATELLVILGLEALVLTILVAVLVWRSLAVPYCHACRRRCQRRLDVLQRATHDRDEAVRRVLACDWGYVRMLEPPDSNSKVRLRFDTATCLQCKRLNTLSLTQVRKLLGNKPLIKDMRLTEDDLRTLKGLA
jgi:hypothetical protein